MNRWILLPLALLAAPAMGQAVYKCPGPDGRPYYQQSPCPQGARMTIQDNGSGSGAAPDELVPAASGIREGEKAMLESARVRDEASAQRAHEAALQAERAAVAREAIQAERARMAQLRAIHCARYPNSNLCR